MVFYGIRSNTDQQYSKLEEEISVLKQKRDIILQNNLGTFRRQFGLSTLAYGLGNIISQSILSSQYVLDCIETYFRRQWTQPALYNLSPLINQYQKLPEAATDLKYKIVHAYSLDQRLTAVLLATSVACASSITLNPAGWLVASGRIMGTFGGLSFLGLPEVSQRVADSVWLEFQ